MQSVCPSLWHKHSWSEDTELPESIKRPNHRVKKTERAASLTPRRRGSKQLSRKWGGPSFLTDGALSQYVGRGLETCLVFQDRPGRGKGNIGTQEKESGQ